MAAADEEPPQAVASVLSVRPPSRADSQASSYRRSSSFGSQRSTRSTKGTGQRRRKRVPGSDTPGADKKTPFTPQLLTSGLSQLGKTADGLRTAYLTMTIKGSDLENTDPVVQYPHLQTLLLSENKLKSIKSLGSLQHLTHLDVSKNCLTQVLDMTLAHPHCNLRVADLSHNAVMLMRDLSPYSRLQRLNLNSNRIEHITGMQGLSLLQSLSIAKNNLLRCSGLEGLHHLRELDLSGNRLSSLQALSTLQSLESLDASSNALSHLRGVEALVSLRKLDIANNRIPTLGDIAYARGASLLSVLSMANNPLERCMSVRLHVVHLLPQVTVLNSSPVEAKEKVLAANMHAADAEDLWRIRRKYFPNGELDDGGGAIPPTSAGLIASNAEEEASEDAESVAVRLEGWARSLRPAAVASNLSALVTLCDQLASVCQGQYQLARVCYEWVVRNVHVPPVEDMCQVHVPLFGPKSSGAEAALLGTVQGTWAERVAWLFVHLCHGCELEAVTINGYWRHERILPGQEVEAHNHCWAAVKVNGRWRLVDCAAGALSLGYDPFYVPPAAFIFSYWPLEAVWQLLPDPISLDAWWGLPALSVAFFAKGCKLLDTGLRAVNVIPPVREGQLLPAFKVHVAAPLTPGTRLAHRLVRIDPSKDVLAPAGSTTRTVVAAWPQEKEAVPQAAYEQVVCGPQGEVEVAYGPHRFTSRVVEVLTSLPHAPGEWYLEVVHFNDVPTVGRMLLDGMRSAVQLHVVEEHVVLRVKIVMPPVDPHDPEDGILHDPATPACPLPFTHRAFTEMRAQLVSPPPMHVLEADRQEPFNVTVPGASQVALFATDGTRLDLTPATDATVHVVGGRQFYASIQVPRTQELRLMAISEDDEPDGPWRPLLTFEVLPQSQHIVHQPVEAYVPEIDPNEPQAHSAYEIFRALDLNSDGQVTRREALVGFRHNRQHADILRFPAKIRGSDGTYERFVDTYMQIDTARLGAFNFNELAAYMGVRPRDLDLDQFSDGDYTETDNEYESEGEGGWTEAGGTTRPHSGAVTERSAGGTLPPSQQASQNSNGVAAAAAVREGSYPGT